VQIWEHSGSIWGYDLATADAIADGTQSPLFTSSQYDGTPLPVFNGQPLLDAGKALFGTEHLRRLPPAPGAHVICANKSVTVPYGQDDATCVWCYIAISICKDRDTMADLFIEDAGVGTFQSVDRLKHFLDQHRQAVVASIIACGQDQSVIYDRTYISYASTMIPPGHVGTALTVAPYVVLAKNAVPNLDFSKLFGMTLSEWEKAVGVSGCR